MFKLSHKKSQLTRKYGNTILTILTAFSCLYACKRSSSTTKNVLEEQDVSLLKEMFADTANILVSDFIINLKKKHNADCTSLLDPTPENKTDPLNNPLDESCAEVLELKRLALESHKVTYNRWLAADFYLKYLLMQRPANIVSLATEVFKGAYTPKYQEMVTVEKHERHPGESEAEVSFSLQKVPLYCAHITECTNMLHYIANFSAVIPEQVLKVLMQIQKSIPIALKDQNMAVVLLDQRVRLLIQLALKNHLLFDSKENITKITAGSLPNITEQEYQALEKIKKNLEEIAEEASTSFTLLTSIGSSEDRSHLPSFEHLPGELRIIAKAILPTMLNSELTRLSDGELRALNVDEHVLKDPENIKFQDLPTDAQDFLISTISIMLNDHLITYETALSESIYLQRLSKISNPQKVYDLREWGDALLQKISKNEISAELALNILIEHDGYEVTLPSRRQWMDYLNRVYELLQTRFNQHKTKLLSYYGISNQEYFCREPYQKAAPDIREFCTAKAKLEGEQLALEKFINKIQNSHKKFENAIAKNLDELTGDTSGKSIVEKELILIQKLLRQSNLFSSKINTISFFIDDYALYKPSTLHCLLIYRYRKRKRAKAWTVQRTPRANSYH
ncbi:MAG: hypothetical protein R3B45_02485 [Bdellovibrionota bacterium]